MASSGIFLTWILFGFSVIVALSTILPAPAPTTKPILPASNEVDPVPPTQTQDAVNSTESEGRTECRRLYDICVLTVLQLEFDVSYVERCRGYLKCTDKYFECEMAGMIVLKNSTETDAKASNYRE